MAHASKSVQDLFSTLFREKKTAGGRHDIPRPSPPSVGAEAPIAPPSTLQRSSSFPRPIRSHAHRCSCVTR